MSSDSYRTPQGDLMLFVQKALVGEVTPELRMVVARFDEQGAHARFVYESALTDEMLETVAVAETEVSADFSGLAPVSFVAETLLPNEPLVFHPGEFTAYRRRESSK